MIYLFIWVLSMAIGLDYGTGRFLVCGCTVLSSKFGLRHMLFAEVYARGSFCGTRETKGWHE
jgi:hypothetical protein